MKAKKEARTRIERDSMGPVSVPAASLYGAQTERARQNFKVSNRRFPRAFLRAMGLIKASAARVNREKGLLRRDVAARIERAAESVIRGMYDHHFVLDVFQTGSGTSTHMNANEVIGRLARAHPNDEVNCSQSSNDVIPSAIHIAAMELIEHQLAPALKELHAALARKAKELDGVVKIGRTHLQDAVPIRMGQEFGGYARQVELSLERIRTASQGLLELPLGGTAVGTGLNAPAGFGAATIALIAKRTGLAFREATNHFEAQAARDAACFLMSALKTTAVSLTKIANDIRWMASGPRAGLGELFLPSLQPGSSMMPGKVNPVMAESLLMVCAEIVGHDAAVSWACASGNFELNVMLPLVAYDLLDSISLLAVSSQGFAARCVRGLKVNRQHVAALMERTLAMATALAPEIGYDRAAELVSEAYQTGKTLREVALKHSGIPAARLARLLDAEGQTGKL